MFWVLFAPIIRSTTAAYSHRYLYLWKAEVLVSSGVEVYFMWICVYSFFKISCDIYVLVCVIGSVLVLCGHDVWFLHR
jgi:hypothetical protein